MFEYKLFHYFIRIYFGVHKVLIVYILFKSLTLQIFDEQFSIQPEKIYFKFRES